MRGGTVAEGHDARDDVDGQAGQASGEGDRRGPLFEIERGRHPRCKVLEVSVRGQRGRLADLERRPSQMTRFPPEIYQEIISFAFCTNGPSTPFSEPTPRRGAVALRLVSRTFHYLSEAAFWSSITISRSEVWTALFDRHEGLLVVGEHAEVRRGRILEVSIDLQAVPPAKIRRDLLSDVGLDDLLPSFGFVTCLPLATPPLPNATHLVFHTPSSPPRQISVDRRGVAFDYWHRLNGTSNGREGPFRGILKLAELPVRDLVASMQHLSTADVVYNDRTSYSLDAGRDALLASPVIFLRYSRPCYTTVRFLPSAHPRHSAKTNASVLDNLRPLSEPPGSRQATGARWTFELVEDGEQDWQDWIRPVEEAQEVTSGRSAATWNWRDRTGCVHALSPD